jgi:hypothetical protein
MGFGRNTEQFFVIFFQDNRSNVRSFVFIFLFVERWIASVIPPFS